MKTCHLALLGVALIGCRPAAQPQPLDRDGTSLERAIIIEGATNEESGVMAEKAWLKKRYPVYHEESQSMMSSGGRHYDLIEIGTSDGHKSVYFDITEFFGK